MKSFPGRASAWKSVRIFAEINDYLLNDLGNAEKLRFLTKNGERSAVEYRIKRNLLPFDTGA